jgi:hypothetical protein
MGRAGVLVAILASTVGCDDLTTITIGAGDGIPPFWYEETLAGLPPSFTPADWPDGTRELVLNTWQSVEIAVDTLADGGRQVTLTREAWLLDAGTSAFYRDTFGEDKIKAIHELSLDFDEILLEQLDETRTGAPQVSVAGIPVGAVGETIWLPTVTVEDLRSRLLAGEDIWVPFSIGFHLAPQALDALPAKLHIYVEVQPTLYVDLLSL